MIHQPSATIIPATAAMIAAMTTGEIIRCPINHPKVCYVKECNAIVKSRIKFVDPVTGCGMRPRNATFRNICATLLRAIPIPAPGCCSRNSWIFVAGSYVRLIPSEQKYSAVLDRFGNAAPILH